MEERGIIVSPFSLSVTTKMPLMQWNPYRTIPWKDPGSTSSGLVITVVVVGTVVTIVDTVRDHLCVMNVVDPVIWHEIVVTVIIDHVHHRLHLTPVLDLRGLFRVLHLTRPRHDHRLATGDAVILDHHLVIDRHLVVIDPRGEKTGEIDLIHQARTERKRETRLRVETKRKRREGKRRERGTTRKRTKKGKRKEGRKERRKERK